MRLIIGTFFFMFLAQASLCQSIYSPNFEKAQNSRIDPSDMGEFIISLKDANVIKEYNLEVLHFHQPSNSYHVKASWQTIELLIANEKILFIDLNRTPKEESALDEPNFEFNRIRKAQATFPDLKGYDQLISIKERQFNPEDLDLVNKHVELGLAAEDQSQHATDMATIISGIGNSSPLNQGAAPGAKLTSSDFNNLLPDSQSIFTANNIHLQNHSYGIGVENYYGVEAVAYDQSVYDHPTNIHVFSAGNSGTASPETGTYAGLPFANLTGTFKQAKNILTVSAVDTALSINALNSRGPAYDGRIKPELTAYGGRGTSDAAAIVSGIISLMQDQYEAEHGVYPPTSLIKSILISTADDIGPEGIDYYTGYGSANAVKAVDAIKQGYFTEVSVSQGEEVTFDLVIPANASEIKIAVSWTDLPAAQNANTALVNDLDLSVSFEGSEYFPWILKTSANEADLNALPTRGEDHLNNVELITISNPAAGTYSLKLKGTKITSTEQIAHVAWNVSSNDEFEWDYPTSKSLVTTNTNMKAYWNSGFGSAHGSLGYLYEGDIRSIARGIDLTSGFYQWKTPELSGKYQLKMTIGDQEYLSPEFIISETPEVEVAFNCATNFGMQWNAIEGASGYQIYEMQSDSLRAIGTTTESSFIVDKNTSEYYSVAPIFENLSGVRNLAFNYGFQGAFCYFNLFSAQKADLAVALELSLSSTLNVSTITFLKESNGVLDTLNSIVASSKTIYNLRDSDLDPGTTSYYAYLTFEDGSGLLSDAVNVLVDEPGKVTFFPNPIDDIYIYALTNGEKMSVEIYDRAGKLVLDEILLDQVNSINLEELDQGVYFYRVFKDGEVYDEGRLIKL
ncbi:S8 family peptidase [Marinoscillum pacificum]|uniref:S8 family peptidase n=1 Tax=Marinoscillum pacificum TaxID=392723 RepID=UPI002157620A|nr:S8 family peptidase [Marinoscillum pacificum]